MVRLNSPAALETFRKSLQTGRDPQKLCITICAGTGCLAHGTQKLIDDFKAEIDRRKLKEKVDIRTSGCHGFCERGPLVVIHPKRIFYQRVGLGDAAEIIDKTIGNNELIDRLLYVDPVSGEKMVHENDVPFYAKQTRLVLGMNGQIDPTRVEDYVAIGGYSALAKVISGIKPEKVIEEITQANLRGRGGGGFPTGWKWAATRKAEGRPKYVICNADEGDPGAYMDRSLLEGNPHSVFEGMIIGAYAIGANNGYIYVRHEYPLAVKHITYAIQEAREFGFLGEGILGSNFDFDVKVNRGGGAFVCGESSALFASIEGRPGEPRAKYVHATDRGLYNKPTALNNVETWANVPLIVNNGADRYRKIGTEGSKGTKIFSLVGNINNTGLVEVPMGITLREIIYDIGGGIPDGRKFKAVQTGGPSGGCIPEEHLDMPVDFDQLSQVGSMMGSGGMIVMDEDTCMVDVARYFLEFLREESCGKCIPCREGIKQMLKILNRIAQGRAEKADLKLLKEIAEVTQAASLCALGRSAPNPVFTTLRYFEDEYLAHIEAKKCPACVCKELFVYYIDPEKCQGCMICQKNCPAGAVSGQKNEVPIIDQERCTKCGTCYALCPPHFGAIRKISGTLPPLSSFSETTSLAGEGT